MLKRALTTVLIAAVLMAGLDMPVRAATGTALPFVKPQYFDVNGVPLSGAQLFVYTAGTSTKITTYSDAALTTPNTNPVVLDSAGRASVFVPGGTLMKLVMAPSTDTDPPSSPYWTVDGVSAIPPASTSADVDVTATAGESLSTGDLVCLSDGSGGNTAGRWYKCDADFTYLSNLAPATGVANAAISTGSTGTVRRLGRITGLSGLVAGTLYYASATGGALTSSKPTNARAVGSADSTTTLILVPTNIDASSTFSGLVSTGTQTLAGAKTFSTPPVFNQGTSSTADATISGRIASDFTTHSIAGSGAETDLATATISANTLSADGKAIRVIAWGTEANNVNTKTLRFYIGATSFTVQSNASAGAGIAWYAEVTIIRTGASAERLGMRCNLGSGGAAINYSATQGTAAISTTASITIKFTGQSSAASVDVTQEGMIVEVVG